MTSLATTALARSRHLGRGVLRASLLASPLALALTLLNGCECPPAQHPFAVADSPEHLQLVETTIANAKTNRLWTLDDERTFSHSQAHMSLEKRFAYATQIADLINTKQMRMAHLKAKTPPPPFCACTPNSCDAPPTPVRSDQPPPAAPPPDTRPTTKVK